MDAQTASVKMVTVDGDLLEAVGYESSRRRLYVKFRNSPPLYFEGVPHFRHQGLMAAPRKDAYFRTFIKNQFLTKPAEVPPQT